MAKIKIGGIIQNTNLAQVAILGIAGQLGAAGKIFAILGAEGINVQFIVQIVDSLIEGNVVFCVDQKDLERTLETLEKKPSWGRAQKIIYHSPVAIISIFGPHFREKPGLAGRMFSALEEAGIDILAISTSISTLSCVIAEPFLTQAVQALTEAFELP